MSLMDEGDLNHQDFKHQFNTVVKEMGESLLGRFHNNVKIPILRDARGKIILLKRSGTEAVEVAGINVADFESKWRTKPNVDGVWYSVSDRF